MDQDTRDLITWTLATTVSAVVLIGMATRFILLPWLKDHLVTPMRDTRRQVVENGHTNESPTIPDRLEDLASQLGSAAEAHSTLSQEFRAALRVVDEHLAWSERWTALIDRELQQLRDRMSNHDHQNGDSQT